MLVRARASKNNSTEHIGETTASKKSEMPHSSQIDRIDRRKQRPRKATALLKCTKQKAWPRIHSSQIDRIDKRKQRPRKATALLKCTKQKAKQKADG